MSNHIFQDSAGKAVMPTLTASGKVPVEATVTVGDIEVGSVEIKNSTDDTRATVDANGLYVSGKDRGPAWTVSRTPYSSADASSGADATAAPTSGQKIVVDDLIVSVGTAMTVTFAEETSGTVVLKVYMDANTTLQITPRNGFKLAVADKKLRVTASVAGNIATTISYHSES